MFECEKCNLVNGNRHSCIMSHPLQNESGLDGCLSSKQDGGRTCLSQGPASGMSTRLRLFPAFRYGTFSQIAVTFKLMLLVSPRSVAILSAVAQTASVHERYRGP